MYLTKGKVHVTIVVAIWRWQMEIENNLKVWRAKWNITQEQLAKEVNLSRQTINSVERGKFVPTVLSALKIAAYFKTNVEDVFRLKGEEK